MAVSQINGTTQIQDATVTPAKVTSGVIVASGANAFSGDQSFGGFKATSVAPGTAGTDAVNLNQLNAAVNGLDWKNSVRVASTANVTIASGLENGDTIDGVTLATGDRVLLKDQSTGSQNGIYVVVASGAASRATDFDADVEVTAGASVFVSEGTANANTQWTLTTDDPIVVGTTALVFAQIGGSSSYTAGTGIDITGNAISVLYGTSSTTAAVGNDARLSDARTPVGTALTSALIWVGSAGNVAAAVALSGDVTITNAGVATVANQLKLTRRIIRETPSGTVNGSNVTFTLAATPVSGSEEVFVNGLLQDAGSGNDYTISSGTITFEAGSAPPSGSKVRANYVSTTG